MQARAGTDRSRPPGWAVRLLPAVLFAVLVVWVVTASAQTDPAKDGAWSAPFSVPVIGVHSAVLPNGKVLLFNKPLRAAGSEAWLWDPATEATTDVSQQYRRDIFCAAHSFLPDGRLFVAGGHIPGGAVEDEAGVPETDVFDHANLSWTPAPTMVEARWYPTTVQLATGNVLTFGGMNGSQKAVKVESYDPVSNKLTTLPSGADKALGNYPRLHPLTDGRVLLSGPSRGSQMFNPATNKWSWVGNMQFGSRQNGSSVLLPGLKKVLAFGGNNSSSGVTATAEILDVSVRKPTWRYTGSMNIARTHANAVLLPDGTVLALGGGQSGAYGSPVTAAELYDPATETWRLLASQTAPRIYHSTAVLLPDGRVLSAGMDKGTYQYTAEIFSPPYLFKGVRPVIGSAPSSIGYGEQFTIHTADAGQIAKLALVRPGSVTHSVAFDQTYVDLPYTTSTDELRVTAPPNGNHAPPGWYMMFAVNSAGVPSVASWVHVR